ncbi:MAG: inositol monophosphatase [Actinomycetota bacterium]|nr:inositol monophosphatase [Actinomycetota bacterium]
MPSASTPLPDSAEQLAIALASDAARSIATIRASSVTTKLHPADLVTELDTGIESEVRDRLLGAFPDHRLVGEEFGASGNEQAHFTWFCDPVDGTTNYANDLGWSAFSLCCTDSTGPLLGVVAHPVRRELVVSRRGGGAWRWGVDDDFRPTGEPEKLAVSTTASLAGTIFTTELRAHLPWPGMFGMIEELAARSCTVRILGSSALTLLQVAAGRAAGAVISIFSPIDNLASMLASLEAGAVCLDSDGNATTGPATGGVLVAAPNVADELSSIWRRTLAG